MLSKLIIKGSALSVVQILVQLIVTFFMMPFVISHLGKHLYGVWILIGTFVGYYGLMDFGISGAVMRFVSRAIGADARRDVKYYVSSAFFVLTGAGTLVIFISIGASILSGIIISDPQKLHLFRFAVLILGFSIGLSFPLRVFDGVLNANLRVDLKRYIEILQLLFRTILIVVVLINGGGILGLAAASGFSMLVEFLLKAITALKIDPAARIKFSCFSKITLREMKDFSIHNFIQSLYRILSKRVDPYLVAVFAGVTSVTYYGVALSLVEYFERFFFAVIGVLFPVFSQKEGARDIEGIKRFLILLSRLSIICASFVAGMAILYGKHFIQCWLGPDFSETYTILLILIFPLIFSLGFFPSAFVLNSIGKHRINTYSDISNGMLNLLLSFILGFLWGPLGIAFGTAIPLIIVGGFVKSFFACKSLGVSVMQYWGKVFYSFFGSAILILFVWYFFGRQINISYIAIFKMILLHGFFFVLIGYFILLPREDVRLIRTKIFAGT